MEKINQLLRLQEERFEQIQKAQINYKKSPKERLVLAYLDTRLENLEKDWQIFKTAHDHLIAHVSKDQRSALAYFCDDIYNQCEEVYLIYKFELKSKIQSIAPVVTESNKPSTSKCKSEIKLPTIQIPTFSGKYIDWLSFKDLFTAIIHNNEELDDVQKLHYLKLSLTGEPEMLLRCVPTTNQNYALAWETLHNRYNNKRYLANDIFKRLFGIKTITSESAVCIKQLLDATVECLSSLNNLGLPTDSWDAIVTYITVDKLDGESKRLWEQSISLDNGNEFTTFLQLKNFLNARFRSLEMSEGQNKQTKVKTFHNITPSLISCAFCKEEHYLYQCKQFSALPQNQRYEFVQTKNLCFNCLTPNHTAAKCMRNSTCRICHKKHHSLLHSDSYNMMQDINQKDQPEDITTHHINQLGQILLATALVGMVSRNKTTYVYRALIDQGSQASFVTEELVQDLGLKRKKISGWVSGLSGGKPIRIKNMVEVRISSRCNTNFTTPVKAYVLKKITTYLPGQNISHSNWPEIKNVPLADPEFNKSNKIDVLLGAGVFTEIIKEGLLKSPSGIIAQNTELGWILSGGIRNLETEKEREVISMHLNVNENEVLRKFWEIENETINSKRSLSKAEKRCEEIYKETTTRTESGRYIVNLPFIENKECAVEKIGKTKEIAISRFLQLERKFKREPGLKEEYSKVIQEYLDLNHMILAEEKDDNTVYLPHHAVVRLDKDTTKVRAVFDASAKGSKGYSLNDTLLVGPTLQRDLRTLIMEWRQHKIAIVSDIVKMYRQILVVDKHTECQRVIWRNSTEEEYKSYKLLTVTFGTASAPFLAVRTLFQVSEDEGHRYPIAAEIVKKSCYMDDIITGASDEVQSLEIYEQITKLLNKAGFELQKWSSNSDIFLENIAQNQRNLHPFEIKFDTIIKTLGLFWDRVNDKFKFSINQYDIKHPVTKRCILSEIARLFDPFGWLAPTIVKAKVFLQKLWLSTAGWDDEIPQSLLDEWLSFRMQIPELEKIELHRWLYIHPNNDRVELHGFADASSTAYAAVVYVRVIQNGKVYISLLESKTKVAPLKQISIPRLELCGAVILAKLLSEASLLFKLNKDQIYAYTDSTVVLAWIQASPMRWQTFVANRVTEIQNHLDNDQWYHVTSSENPADIASRGVDPSELPHQHLWWNGPQWLQNLEEIRKKKAVLETNLEERKQYIKTFHYTEKQTSLLERFSTLNKMLRVLTYCRRWLRLKRNIKGKKENTVYLTWNEIKDTLDICIKMTQEETFLEEIIDLKERKSVKKRSKLLTLTPFLDNAGILRVGGRLQASGLPLSYKHPIILPKDAHLTRLLVKDAHAKLLHGGTALIMNFLRSRYWIIGLKQLVKRCFRECVVCTRHKAATIQPQMGVLPKERVTPSRPFKISGVDFAGPIQIRTSKGRGQRSYKGYICLFICMATRAIHLEMVSDLTTQGFIAAFRRFIARRGLCTDLWSDNGLNFVGAAKELSAMLNECMIGVLKEVAGLIGNDGTVWHFIPPRAPNFGGLWEAGIKSVKTHLTKIIGNSTLTFEEMSTLLCQIEACLNSRPISQLSDHPDDLAPLTPAHFLVGESLVAIPERYDVNETISPLNRWKLIQRMMVHFWKRWSMEYLHSMQQRHKWHVKANPPQIGDVVLIKDDQMPPTKWLLARIINVHAGPDGEIRVVDLKCKDSTLKRPLSKLVFLPKLN